MPSYSLEPLAHPCPPHAWNVLGTWRQSLPLCHAWLCGHPTLCWGSAVWTCPTCWWQKVWCRDKPTQPHPALTAWPKEGKQAGRQPTAFPRAAASHVTLLFFLAVFLWVSFQMGKQLFSHLGCWEEDASPGCSWPGGAGTKCRGCTKCWNGLYMGVKHRAVIHLTGCTSTSPLVCFLTASITWNVSCDTGLVLGKSLRLWVIYTWSLCCLWS